MRQRRDVKQHSADMGHAYGTATHITERNRPCRADLRVVQAQRLLHLADLGFNALQALARAEALARIRTAGQTVRWVHMWTLRRQDTNLFGSFDSM